MNLLKAFLYLFILALIYLIYDYNDYDGDYKIDVSSVEDSILERYSNGYVFECQEKCAFKAGANKRQLIDFFQKNDYNTVSKIISSIGLYNDLQHFLLGWTFEQRGQFNLAKKFYSSSKKAFKCGGFINTCEGLDIPYEVSRALNRIKTSKQALAPPGEAPTGAQTIPSKLDKKKLIVDKSLTAKAGKGISSKSIDDNTILLKNYYGNINKFKSHASKTVLSKPTSKSIKHKASQKITTGSYDDLYASRKEAEKERSKRKELERKLAILLAKQKQEEQKIDTDTRVPILEIISNKTKGKRGTITGIARDNIKVAEVTIDGKPVSLSSNGNFNFSTYVPPKGKELKVEVTDIAGLTTSKIIKLKANRMISDSPISFESLNPLNKRVKKNEDALALIVGVSNYENTKAKALYADNDAMVFKDYATEKLGISKNRIKILLNDGADERDILLSVQEWLRRSAKPNKSDIYIFFAGHGLASHDGNNMYLLPHDGSPRLLEKTAILRDELFSDIKEANPKSVTVFLDTCYSGETRNEEVLVAGRPVAIIAKEQAIPDGFTLFSAASNEQISRPLEEAKHGMFSYFLMKGMEGDADSNNDNEITARELHAYVEQNVVQQSSGSQTPELQGDKDRVLIQFN